MTPGARPNFAPCLHLLAALLITASASNAQAVLPQQPSAADSGRVTVTVMNDSLPQSMAFVESGALRVRTDSTGKAALTLAAGPHVLTAIGLGLRPDSVSVIVAAGMDTSVTINLSAVEIASIVISATRSERRIEDDPLRVEVLEREEVEEKLLMTPGDITMMLNESSGLRVQTTSPSLGGASVRVQGLRGRYTQLLSDGLPLYGGQTGGLGLLQVPPMDLGGVEIIKGVASALYGGSALGGVINLISRRPAGEEQRDILVNQTTLGGTDVVGFASESVGQRWGFTALLGGHRQTEVDRDDDGWVDLPSYHRLVVRPRLFWNDPAGHSAMVTVGSTIEQRNGGTEDGALTPDGTPYRERLRTGRYDLGGVGRWLVGRNVISARGSASSQNHRHTFGPFREKDAHLTWFGEVSNTYMRGTAVWVLGTALQQERYSNNDVEGFDFVFTTPSVFSQSTLDVGTRLSLTLSGRLDDHSEYGAQFAPRVSGLLRVGAGWTVRASAGSGYFAPTPFTEETEVTGLRPLQWLSNVRAERAVSGSLDLGGSIGPVEVNATIFRSTISNPVAVRIDVLDESRIRLGNTDGDTRTAGGELLARWNPEPFHITATYTYVDSNEEDPETGLRREVPLTPTQQAGVVAAWEEENRSRIGVELYYTGSQTLDDNPYRTISKPYVHLGTMAERRLGRVRVFVNAENLLGFRQTRYDRLVLPTRGMGGRWTTDVWGPLEGRVANIGFRIDSR